MGFDWSTAQEVPQGSVVEGPSGEAIQLPPNTNAQNAYGNLPAIEEEKAPVTKAQITPDNKTPSAFDWSSAKELTIPSEQSASTIALPQATPQQLANAGTQGYPQPSVQQGQDQGILHNYLTGVADKGISNIVDPLIMGLKFGRDILSQPKDQPYDWKGAGLAAGSTVLEQAPGLMLGEKIAPVVTEATSPFITPIGGAALGMTSMLATQQATAFGIQKLEGLVGLRDQIEQAQKAHPYVTEGSADLVMAPMAIKSLGNIGSTFAKTLDAKGATAAATELAKNITGGAFGGTLLGPLRYGLESLEYGTGITKEKPTPITGSEELQNGIIGAILHGYHSQQKIDTKLGGPAPEVAPSENPSVNEKEASIVETAKDQSPPLTQEQPAEAPVAEAQPEKPNAIQEQTTGEVGIRNAPAVGEGVGRQNEAEVPTQEGQVPKEEVKPEGFIAFHGTPHDFDKFSIKSISTGEGSQSYGRGLYFAENAKVAENYQKRLGERLPTDGSTIADSLSIEPDMYRRMPEEDINDHIEEIKAHDPEIIMDKNGFRYIFEDGSAIEDTGDEFKPFQLKSNIYKVKVNLSPKDFLDWDSPLTNQQKEKLKPIIDSASKSFPALKTEEITGNGLYSAYLEHRGNNAEQVVKDFSNLGIKGIKYLDKGSRGEEIGTRNYVVFNDNDVEITHKNGEPIKNEEKPETKPEPLSTISEGKAGQEEIATGKNLLPEDRLFISDLAKDAKEKIISVGAASPEEFMQRYAIIGAKAIMDGHQSEGRFAAEIMKEIPSLNPDLIHDVYTRAGELINQLEFGGGEKTTPIQRFLEKKPKAPQETITINPKTELKKSLREQQKAGEAGYKRGVKETWNEAKEIISGLNEKIKNSITKAQALSEYLRGQEKGAKIATDTFRRNIKSADKILSLDQEDIRRDLTELVKKLLPPAERGRFIGAITKALKRPNILTGDPMTMYKNAANVMTAIRARADEVYRKGVIGDIRDTVDRALKSPTVDLQFKNLISKALKDVNIKTFSSARLSELKSTRDYLNRMEEEGKDVYIPKQILDAVDQIGKTPIKDLPIETLENLNTKLKLMERLGRMKFKSRQAAREAEEQLRMSEILKGDSMPLEKNPEFKAQPGEKLTLKERVSNRLARFYNATTSMDIAHLPQDVIFDWLQGMKGKYSGPLFDHIRTPMDSAYDAVQRNTSSVTDPLKDIIKHYKLTNQDEEKIGLWAQLQQERGEDVALETGVTPKTINDLKASGLTNGQKAAYNYMRRVLDSTLPRIQETMHDLYNVPVESIKNYFPWMRDYEKYNADPAQPIFDAKTGKQISQEELDSFSNLVGNLSGRNTAKTPQGFTIERKPGATPAIRYDAFDVFQRHMYNANRLIELQPTARMASKMINSDSFKEKFGDYGQQLLKEWMTHTVTDGQGGNIHRLQLLDWARRGSSKGLVFFNIVSNIKHISAIPQGFLNAGSPSNWWSGMHLQHTSEGEAFLKNFPQLTQRGAGELSFSELQKNLLKDPEGIFPKTMNIADRYGFVVGKLVDEINSRSVFIGRYLDNLKQKGLNPSLKGPIDEQAAYNAMAYMRRTVSSTLPKDIQPVLGKGAGFGGNVSLARTMNAFKQFALERWSLMRYDIPAAFKSGNYSKGVATIAACLAAGIYETQLPGVLKGMSQGIFGKPAGQKEDKETWYQKLLMDSLTMIPYVSIPVSMALYKDAGIPIVDVVRNMAMSGYGAATAKTGEGTKGQLINFATATGELAGVPGSAVLGKGAKAMFVDPELQKKEAAQVAKETRQEKAKTKTTAPHTIKTIGGIKPIKTIR